jgi:hypothetical protein
MRFVASWRAWRTRRQLAQRLSAARRGGHALYVCDWQLAVPTAESDPDHTWVEPILLWCRDVLAECRRPWGVDQFDLTLAWRSGGSNGRPRRVQWRRLRPPDLYDSGWLANHLAAVYPAGQPAVVHVAAGLFSWGEALHRALPATDARTLSNLRA